ncbi:MAG: 3-methyl-2-oxobutanoate hydroxymethyltransferase [Lysobacteraceae bacterium]|nr:MAG: 3-methyl-2-oxobutanoate hydroxymethyltransferase [Xanthomonadaceae bacterium]
MYNARPGETEPPVTVPSLRQRKARGERLSMVTCYDASFAARLEAAGVELILVGDSLGMVVQGHRHTLGVTVDHMVYHSAAVARGARRPLLIVDLPYQAAATPERALHAAARLQAEGNAAMVKLEGGAGHVLDAIRFLVERDIPVCGHLGLTPQSVHRLGGFRLQGREPDAARLLREQALAVQQAGAELLVLECVPSALATEITALLEIPTIGIGAGPGCDGQVLVMHDLLGVTPGRRPRFVRDFLAEGGSVEGAFRRFVEAVREGSFPGPEHSYE